MFEQTFITSCAWPLLGFADDDCRLVHDLSVVLLHTVWYKEAMLGCCRYVDSFLIVWHVLFDCAVTAVLCWYMVSTADNHSLLSHDLGVEPAGLAPVPA